jgi:hypothetical protein
MPFDLGSSADATRYERILGEAGDLGARLAAAARHARRTVPAPNAHERAICDVAAGVAGPLLVAYVLWILEDARARGIERLYFLSRDAEVLRELAEILAPRLGLAIELRYLYASRKAWLGARSDAWPWDNSIENLTLGDVLGQLSIPHEAVAADLARLGLGRPDAPLDREGRQRLRSYLLTSDHLAPGCPDRAEARRLLHDYLDQEKMFDGVPKAVVDLGGHGTQHEALCQLLEQRGAPACPLYLFWGDRYDGWSWMALRRCFHFDGSDATGPRVTSHVMMEAFCSAEHGTLTGYRRAGDRVEPVLGADRSEVLRAWGLPLMRETLAAFARAVDPARRELARDLGRDLGGECAANPALRQAIDHLSDAFWRAPTVEEAHAWCRFPWDLGKGAHAALATPYALGDIPRVLRRRSLRKAPSFWVPGALAITPAPVATLLHGLRGAFHAGRLGWQAVSALGRQSGRLAGGPTAAPGRR